MNHTYVTSTQDYQDLSGLRIKCAAADSRLGNAVGVLVGGREVQVFYIDGRLVLTTNGFQSAETYLQLPPGKHELVVAEQLKGSVVAGGSATTPDKYRIEFTLGRGANATVTTVDWVVQTFTGVEGYTILEGPQVLGSTLVNRSDQAAAGNGGSVETRLRDLKRLHGEGLISDEVYQKRMAELVADIK